MPTQRYRSVCYTVNNYTDQDIALARTAPYGSGHVCGLEVGETGTPHMQGYINLKEKLSCKALHKYLPHANFQESRAPQPKDAWNYCKKGKQPKADWEAHKDNSPLFGLDADVVIEEGQYPQPGARNDLKRQADRISAGETTLDKLSVEDPMIFHQYGRTLSKLEDLKLRQQFRTEMTACTWLHGPTGVGKSHEAFQDYHPDTHYLWKLNDHGWQDGYTGQPIVIMNDYRGEIKYNDMLNIIDKWPYTVPRRSREPAPFLAKKVIITSSLPPSAVYHHRQAEDKLEQLLDRINVVELTGDNKRQKTT